ADDPSARPTPREGRIRAVLLNPIHFERYIIDGSHFPKCAFERIREAEEQLGPYSVETTFYDREFRRVSEAAQPGPYAVVVEVVPKEGRPLTRFFTLYRTPKSIPDDELLENKPASVLAECLGLHARAIERQRNLITKTFQGLTFVHVA